jgi:cytochrome c oxidase cbb3-type subunit 2
MPSYGFLADNTLSTHDIADHLRANSLVGVPYDDEMIANAEADMRAQADIDANTEGLETRYPKVRVADFDGDPNRLTEMDAMVAYLQMLGTLVDFTAFDPKANER